MNRKIALFFLVLAIASLACSATVAAGSVSSEPNTTDFELRMNDNQQVPVCEGDIVTMTWIKVHDNNKVDVNLAINGEDKDVEVQSTALIGGYNFINWGDRVEVECNP